MIVAQVAHLMSFAVGAEPAPSEPPSPRADVTPLFVSGEVGYGRYRIPSLYVTPKQTVLAFCEGRVKPPLLPGCRCVSSKLCCSNVMIVSDMR
jgi:hypothetical protein